MEMSAHFARLLHRFREVSTSEGFVPASMRGIRLVIGRPIAYFRFLARFFLLDWRGLPVVAMRALYTKGIDERFHSYGNYFLFDQSFNEDSIVYSFGIGKNITFDRAVSDRFGCSVYAYDPTPFAIRHMASNENPKIKFFPIGLWVEDGSVNFHVIRRPDGEIVSGSIMNIHDLDDSEIYSAPVRSLCSIMNENGHDHIDILKMDIEGAALPVLNMTLCRSILPSQIVAEFEFPERFDTQFLKELHGLFKKLRQANYRLASLPMRTRQLSYSIELIAYKC